MRYRGKVIKLPCASYHNQEQGKRQRQDYHQRFREHDGHPVESYGRGHSSERKKSRLNHAEIKRWWRRKVRRQDQLDCYGAEMSFIMRETEVFSGKPCDCEHCQAHPDEPRFQPTESDGLYVSIKLRCLHHKEYPSISLDPVDPHHESAVALQTWIDSLNAD